MLGNFCFWDCLGNRLDNFCFGGCFSRAVSHTIIGLFQIISRRSLAEHNAVSNFKITPEQRIFGLFTRIYLLSVHYYQLTVMLDLKADTVSAVCRPACRYFYVSVPVVADSFALHKCAKTVKLCRHARLPCSLLAESQHLAVKVVCPALRHVEYIAKIGTLIVLLSVNGSLCRRQPYAVSYLKGKRRRFGDVHHFKAETVLSRIFFSTAARRSCQRHAAVHKAVPQQDVRFADADFLQSAAARKSSSGYHQYRIRYFKPADIGTAYLIYSGKTLRRIDLIGKFDRRRKRIIVPAESISPVAHSQRTVFKQKHRAALTALADNVDLPAAQSAADIAFLIQPEHAEVRCHAAF